MLAMLTMVTAAAAGVLPRSTRVEGPEDYEAREALGTRGFEDTTWSFAGEHTPARRRSTDPRHPEAEELHDKEKVNKFKAEEQAHRKKKTHKENKEAESEHKKGKTALLNGDLSENVENVEQGGDEHPKPNPKKKDP